MRSDSVRDVCIGIGAFRAQQPFLFEQVLTTLSARSAESSDVSSYSHRESDVFQ